MDKAKKADSGFFAVCLFSSIHFDLAHHAIVFMLQDVAVVDEDAFFRESDEQFHRFVGFDQDGVLEPLFMRFWRFAIA